MAAGTGSWACRAVCAPPIPLLTESGIRLVAEPVDLPAKAAPDLRRFFNPGSVALVGATEDLSRFAGKALLRMMDFGYRGKVYPVNPRFSGKTVRGHACYASVQDLPEAPDHVGVVVPAHYVLGILEESAARGARFWSK